MIRETELQMVQRHVREGRQHIGRQHAIIARLRSVGSPIELAEEVLTTLEVSQRQHEEHLGRVLATDAGLD